MTSVKCKNCGTDIPANMKFCGTCGTPAEHPEITETGESVAVPPASGKSAVDVGKLKKFIKPAIVIVAVIIVASIALSIFKPSKYSQLSSTLLITQEEDSVVIVPDGKSKMTIDGQLQSQSYSLDGKTAAILVSESDESADGSDSEGYALYIVTDKATLITDGVYSMQLSLSGDGIAFIKEVDSIGRTAELCLWTGGKVSTVTTDYLLRNSFSISPDGKTVAYTIYDEDEGEVEGCYYDGKVTSLGEDIIPQFIANGAKYIYYNKEHSFYVQKGSNSDTKNKLGEDIYGCFFNNDLTQIIYNSSGKAYISRSGGKKESLSGTIDNFLLPKGTVTTNQNNGYVIGVSSFANTFYFNGSSVIHIDGKFETNSVVKKADNPQHAKDGKTIFYQKSDSVYKIDGTKENAEDKELVEEDVYDFIATYDGSAIYFYNTDDELFYQKGTGKPVQIGEDLGGTYIYGEYWAMFNGNKLFFISDDELFWSTGGKGKAVTGIDGDVSYVQANKVLYVIASDTSNIYTYFSKDGEKFELYSTN